METIPTPRTTAEEYRAGMSSVKVVDASFARQLERELHIAKQALESIKATTGGAHIAVAKAEAIHALEKLNTLSA